MTNPKGKRVVLAVIRPVAHSELWIETKRVVGLSRDLLYTFNTHKVAGKKLKIVAEVLDD